MRDIVFIGDALTAAGFRLAGVASYAPGPERLVERVEAERARAQVLAMTMGAFEALPATLASELKQSRAPILAILPDIAGQDTPQDMEAEVRRALGIEV